MRFQLKPDNRNATDEEVLADLANTARQNGSQSIQMRDNDEIGRFSSSTITRRFHDWNTALQKAGLETTRLVNISDEELIADVKRVADEIAPLKLTQKIYGNKGKFATFTINKRIGWNKALQQLNLDTHCHHVTENDLFKNMESVWASLGRAPGRRDMTKPLSRYSESPYINRYGSWRKSLESFVEYIGAIPAELPDSNAETAYHPAAGLEIETFRHKTKRDISNRLKVKVLIRDGNKCKLCGLVVTGDNIHFDHIIPWAKDGETVLENLQVLCSPHNLAKGDFYEAKSG